MLKWSRFTVEWHAFKSSTLRLSAIARLAVGKFQAPNGSWREQEGGPKLKEHAPFALTAPQLFATLHPRKNPELCKGGMSICKSTSFQQWPAAHCVISLHVFLAFLLFYRTQTVKRADADEWSWEPPDEWVLADQLLLERSLFAPNGIKVTLPGLQIRYHLFITGCWHTLRCGIKLIGPFMRGAVRELASLCLCIPRSRTRLFAPLDCPCRPAGTEVNKVCAKMIKQLMPTAVLSVLGAYAHCNYQLHIAKPCTRSEFFISAYTITFSSLCWWKTCRVEVIFIKIPSKSLFLYKISESTQMAF